jgi:peptidylprolyl isomerase
MRIAAVLGATVACALLVTSLSACGGTTASSAGGTPSTHPATSAGPASEGQPAASGPQCTAAQIQVTANVGAAPTVTLPKGCATPTALLSRDIVAGTGQAVQSGDSITADYQLTTWSNDSMVQQSFGSQPFTTQIGVGQVIPGWDKGLIGLKSGGRRLLVVPPALGYGSVAQQGIKANETLVFVIDVHSVTGP